MNKLSVVIYIFLSVCCTVQATQVQNEPDDFLDKEFHIKRREALRKMMPEKSVTVFFASPVRNRANDVEYVYHQDPEFYYLTGYREPHAMLLVFKEMQTNDKGNKYNEALFV